MLLQFGQLQGLRMMVFVDGTNFLVELFRTFEITELRAESPRPNTASVSFGLLNHSLQHLSGCRAIRNFWFASFTGNDDNQNAYCQQLRTAYFTPLIFKKLQGHREKRVDISLTTSLLVNAQQKNFDIGVLVSGDADYLSVVEEVKRHGCLVYGCFFEANINPELRIAFDRFLPIQIPDDGREIYRERLLMTEPKYYYLVMSRSLSPRKIDHGKMIILEAGQEVTLLKEESDRVLILPDGSDTAY